MNEIYDKVSFQTLAKIFAAFQEGDNYLETCGVWFVPGLINLLAFLVHGTISFLLDGIDLN